MNRLYDGQWQYEDDPRKQAVMRYRIAQRALKAFKAKQESKCAPSTKTS